MKNFIVIILCSVFILSINTESNAQFDPTQGCITDANGNCLPNTILSAMPFLKIVPDARSGGMGDVGIAIPGGAGSTHFNASKIPFAKKDRSFSVTYTPWLRNLGLNDVYLFYGGGFFKIDEFQAVSVGIRYFSLGEINFTNIEGQNTGTGKPQEIEVAVSYSRKLSENFAAGLTAKFINSNLASGQSIGGFDISSANAFAADLSMTYNSDLTLGVYESRLAVGMALTNIGSKVTYTANTVKDFLPANFGLGAALSLDFDEFNSMTFAFDINKLMIPTPISPTIKDGTGTEVGNPDFDNDNNGIADHREKSLFDGVFGSWGDAPGGFSEELQEFNYSLGVEYWYDNQFAVRLGYYYEHPLKGDRQFLTVGVGLKYNVFGIDVSYLVPTNNRNNPLDNTLRFTLEFDSSVFKAEDL